MKLKPGMPAPAFEAMNEEGIRITLEQYKGKKLILYFYSADGTPTCTQQACNLRDHYKQLQQAGYDVLGISTDSVTKHKNFTTKHKLPFSLLSDPDAQINKLYGVWQLKKRFGREYTGTVRTTFIINEDGIIERIIDKVKAKEHAEQILSL
ncbi:MAG: thioredoxin-dependent thiol peroxidase [Cytophagaceae bacterium]|nr:thioredoxin-dependent thiol peroxidase [Cytophagaceae bacterium]MDW8456084.1 thioredoxin-dependent thiol peroxidase [Cytophagaceae bacterium]